jgi:hypothetical protein
MTKHLTHGEIENMAEEFISSRSPTHILARDHLTDLLVHVYQHALKAHRAELRASLKETE